MKIGILTFHPAHNHGAVLQTLALQEYLSSLFPIRLLSITAHLT